jgi:ABC-2 type transport system ATP-binding protein
MPEAVNINNVSKTFGEHLAVDRLDLNVPAGKIFGFIGPNGSGKTTTIRMILRIIQPDTGNIEVLGRTNGESADDRIGYLPEERGLYRKMKARDLLHFFASLKKARDINKNINLWLERLELLEWADKPIETFSKGMAQKIQFIAAVIANPELVILDEPFSGLDPLNAESLRREVLRLRNEGVTVIFSTHDMAAAESICDSIFMIYKGRKVLDGSIQEIKQQHATNLAYIQTDSTYEQITSLPHVKNADLSDGQWRIELDQKASPQDFLQQAATRIEIQKFVRGGTSLQEIFLAKAGFESNQHA